MSQWSTPSEILQSYRERRLWIAPPQFYELGRLRRLPLLKCLHGFARRRAVEGSERWLPVGFLKDGCYVSLLPGAQGHANTAHVCSRCFPSLYPLSVCDPGDKLYPSGSSGEPEPEVELAADPQEGDELHRIIISDSNVGTVQVNITPKYNHLVPVFDPASAQTSDSHL